MTQPRLASINAVRVFVHNLSLADKFYGQKLGLPKTVANAEVVIYDVGGTQLVIEMVAKDDLEHAGYVGRYTGICFDVQNIDVACRRLKDIGVKFDGEPATQPWGGVFAHFADPDDNVFTLVQKPA